MKRSPNRAALVASWLALGGCAFSDGQPFGVADLSVSARLDSTSERRTPEGAIKTNEDYAVRIERMALSIEGVHLDVIPAGAEAAGFDPADPPAGYSGCHNGHCHSEDGRLVPYEEIGGELAGAGAISVEREVEGDAIELSEEAQAIELGECSSGCELVRGELSSVSIHVEELAFEVHVLDFGAEPRLPAEGLRFAAVLDEEIELSEPIAGSVDDGEPLGVRVEAEIVLPEDLFDSIDWAASSTTAAVDRIAENLLEADALEVELGRFEEAAWTR